MNKRGITLIELIIFIIVGAIFIPLAYVAFTSAVNNSMKPETAETVKSIAEAKMVDIMSMGFNNPPLQNSVYRDVRGDSTNNGGRFSELSYAGYQWKWTYEYIAYQDQGNGSHSITTITNNPPLVNSSPSFKVGDYVRPDASSTSFYRAHFLKWVNNMLYNLNDYVVPTALIYTLPLQVTSAGTSTLLAANEPIWSSAVVNAPFDDGGVTWTAMGLPPAAVWASNTSYNVGNEVSPTIISPVHYTCSIAGKSGVLAPSWPAAPGLTVYDGLRWQAMNATPTITLTSVPSVLPPVPWGTEVNINTNGNQIRWIESNVYRRITVSVKPPNCTIADCEYAVSTIITSRTAL
jgi:hypothetical protein